MLLVIFNHITFFSLGIEIEDSIIAQIFSTFRMPMFFFISGYIAYKAAHHWTYDFYIHRLMTKARVQLVPTVVFYILAYLVLNRYVNVFPGGFWFTESLFEMFLVYFSLAFLCRKMEDKTETAVILISIAAMLILNRLTPYLEHINPNLIAYACIRNTSQFYLFFGLGVLMKKYNTQFIKLIETNCAVTVAIVLSIGLMILQYQFGIFNSMPHLRAAVIYLAGLLFIFVVFASFHKSADFWNRDGWFQNTFEYIGRRTLDLYMLHYFFIPDLPQLHEFLCSGSNRVVMQFFFIGGLTVMVTVCSLLTSILLRTSPVLAKWIFGVSPKKTVAKVM